MIFITRVHLYTINYMLAAHATKLYNTNFVIALTTNLITNEL